MDEPPLGLLIAILTVLILLSAFFSSSETGMMSLNRYRLKHLKKQGHPGAKRVWRLLQRPDRLIGLILIGNNLVNFLAVSVATLISIRILGDDNIALASTVAAIVLTFIVLIFAEVTPKTIAALHPEKIAFPASAVLTPLLKLLYPAVWLINIITNGLLRLAGVDPRGGGDEQLSPDELRTIVDDAGSHIPKRHQGMLLNILDLEQASVEDIMIPRNEIFGLDLDDDDEKLLQRLRSVEFTRIPVFQDDINNVIGILHQRNVSRVIDESGCINRDNLMKEIKEPYFIPETTPLHTQLVNFQQEKRRLGMVVDEYGVVQGIVTLEDILEEIVGEFTSNLADEIKDIHTLKDGTYNINGTATIRDINKNLQWELPTEGPKTLNGLLLEHLESFPDGAVCIEIDNYFFEVHTLKDNVVQTAKAFEGETDSQSQEE